jgi:predicted permease
VRQLLVESLLLASAGAVVGAALGLWSSGLLVERLSRQFPAWVTFDLDPGFLVFTVALTAGATLLFGLAPALHSARRPAAALAGAGRSTGSRRRRHASAGLVVGEVALAVCLLVVGGLTVLDAHRVGRIDPGYAVEGVTTYRLDLPSGRYPDDDARLAFVDAYLDRLGTIPGVHGATIASSLPLLGHWGWFFDVEGAPPPAEGESTPVVLMQSVARGYFDAMRVAMARGRAFDDFDGRRDGMRVAIVNETFVSTFMDDGRDPVGRRIGTGGDDDSWLTIVGVASDVKHYGLDELVRPSVYQPIGQVPLSGFRVALRTEAGASSPLPAARRITAELDPDLPQYAEQTMSSLVDDSLWARRATSWVIASFSIVAVLLAVAGLYGVISYSVRQRSREIGLRIAMGARAEQVRRQVVRQGLVVVLAGVAIGALTALAMGRMVGQLLSQVEPTEPTVYVGVSALLVLVATIANWIPARRAAATDPMAVLRTE